MKKSVQILCKQNPITTLECGKCKHKFQVKSVALHSQTTYKYECEKCHEITTYDTTKFVVEFEKILKSMGIKW